jgi:hypothetical protein
VCILCRAFTGTAFQLAIMATRWQKIRISEASRYRES